MDEPTTRFEQRLEVALCDYVERPDLAREPSAVVADVTARPRAGSRRSWTWSVPRRAAAALVILAVGLTAVIGPRILDLSGSAIGPATAVVKGVSYDLGMARSMRVDRGDLTPYGVVDSGSALRQIADPTAFSLAGIDPRAVLIVRSAPGLNDDNGPYDEYLLLYGPVDPYPAMCDYFEPGDPSNPTVCPPATYRTPEPSRDVMPTPDPVASRSPSPVPSPSPSPSPTASPIPSPTAYDGDRVVDHLVVLLMERTGVGCAREAHVDWDLRAIERQAEAVALNGEVGVVGEENFVLGTLAEAIEGFNGELAATEGPDVAWILSDPDDVELIGGNRRPDADLIALKLQLIKVDDGRDVWWRTRDYVGVGFCR